MFDLHRLCMSSADGWCECNQDCPWWYVSYNVIWDGALCFEVKWNQLYLPPYVSVVQFHIFDKNFLPAQTHDPWNHCHRANCCALQYIIVYARMQDTMADVCLSLLTRLRRLAAAHACSWLRWDRMDMTAARRLLQADLQTVSHGACFTCVPLITWQHVAGDCAFLSCGSGLGCGHWAPISNANGGCRTGGNS
jgi:hypothetical protein